MKNTIDDRIICALFSEEITDECPIKSKIAEHKEHEKQITKLLEDVFQRRI
jgi:hypothetical protein